MQRSIATLLEESRKMREQSRALREALTAITSQSKELIAHSHEGMARAHQSSESVKAVRTPPEPADFASLQARKWMSIDYIRRVDHSIPGGAPMDTTRDR